MKKKSNLVIVAVIVIIAAVIGILFATDTIPADQVSGTIKKSERYRKTQTKVGDIMLAPDVLNDKETGQQLAVNILQLSYITENIADQTEEILSRISASAITENEKTGIADPLSGYHEMVVNNTQLMRKSSEDILAYLESDTKETSGDLDKTFQDIGGFFNRYKTDNNVFTEAISTVESLVADNSDMLQNEAPSDLEIIRDKLYAVAYLNANFLQEKEIKKELLAKIVAQTETVDENPNAIIYNNQVNAFHAVNAQTGTLGITFLSPLSSNLSNYENGVSAHYILFSKEGLSNGAAFATESLSNLAESMDAITLRSMAFNSMEKYSGFYCMNVNDLKSVLSQEDLQALAMSPVMSLTKESAEKLNSVLSQEELNSIGQFSQGELSNSKALEIALGLLYTGTANDLNLQIHVSSLAVWATQDVAAMNALYSCLSQEKLSFLPYNAMEGMIILGGTFDKNLGIHSQVGLDFLPVNIGSNLNNIDGLNIMWSNAMEATQLSISF